VKPDSWVCDSCGDLITDPPTSLLVWRRDADGKRVDFKIVHKSIDGRTCDPGDRAGYRNSVELHNLLGPEGQAHLLSMVSAGPFHGPGETPPDIADFDQWVDVFRRLQTPWYEEARSRFDDDDVQAAFAGSNETQPYRPESLEAIANRTI
jgi:hypothetical protein